MLLLKFAPISTFVSHRSWCLNQKQWIGKLKLILLSIKIYTKCLVFEIDKAKFFAISCYIFKIVCLIFLKMEWRYCSINFYPVFSNSENVDTKPFLYETWKFLAKKVKATMPVAFLIKITASIWRKILAK